MTKNKKIFAISFFVLQILIIAGLIAYSAFFTFFLETFGKEYKFKAGPSVYVSDGVCRFKLESEFWHTEKVYIVPDEQDGVYKLSSDHYAPMDAENYIYYRACDSGSFPEKREYRLKNEPSEQIYYPFEVENIYITVKVFMGKAEVTAVYCDGVPIEEYVKTQSVF